MKKLKRRIDKVDGSQTEILKRAGVPAKRSSYISFLSRGKFSKIPETKIGKKFIRKLENFFENKPESQEEKKENLSVEEKKERAKRIVNESKNRLTIEDVKEKGDFDVGKARVGTLLRELYEENKIDRIQDGRRTFYLSRSGDGIRKKDFYFKLKNLVVQQYFSEKKISLDDMKKVGFNNFSKKTNKLFEKLATDKELQKAIRKDLGRDIDFKYKKSGNMPKIELM